MNSIYNNLYEKEYGEDYVHVREHTRRKPRPRVHVLEHTRRKTRTSTYMSKYAQQYKAIKKIKDDIIRANDILSAFVQQGIEGEERIIIQSQISVLKVLLTQHESWKIREEDQYKRELNGIKGGLKSEYGDIQGVAFLKKSNLDQQLEYDRVIYELKVNKFSVLLNDLKDGKRHVYIQTEIDNILYPYTKDIKKKIDANLYPDTSCIILYIQISVIIIACVVQLYNLYNFIYKN